MKPSLALIALLLTAAVAAQGSLECTVGVRVYPLKYVGATMTMEFKLGIKSSCSNYDSYNFFLLPYNVDYKLTRFKHPKDVVLQLFGKVYQFSFSTPKQQGRGKYLDVLYKFATIKPSKSRKPVYTFAPNNFLLATDEVSLFSKTDVDALTYKSNPCICQLSASNKTMFCTIN